MHLCPRRISLVAKLLFLFVQKRLNISGIYKFVLLVACEDVRTRLSVGLVHVTVVCVDVRRVRS